ncbi:hypothetical protein LOK49_LG01G00261 [Camellia lanceoleosa]|uniref:Uncharacterized protein n=1 Tax=Camellia lanceoleosa TaxID=1840588 RepID=A0ACC0IUB6_9ERIC|nr:hypothetical protein LOK49_LG01G00261 [Camellia lanceoleosa]
MSLRFGGSKKWVLYSVFLYKLKFSLYDFIFLHKFFIKV